MAQFKLNISEKSGKTVQKELTEEESIAFVGKKIGETFSGDSVGYPGYEFQITGGSDSSGVPMRSDNPGSARKRILTTSNTVGFKKGRNGMRGRILVAGNTISEQTAQINAKVSKPGKKPLVEESEPETPSEEAPADDAKPDDDVKPSEEADSQEKPEAKSEEKKDSEEKSE